MKKWYNNWIWYVPGLVVGGISGYFYRKYFGWYGTCLITSSPVRSVIYFAFMGMLLNQMFKSSKEETTETNK